MNADVNSDIVVLLLPGGKGTHTELGAALSSASLGKNKKIWLWSETGESFEHNEKTCAFYFHDNIDRIVSEFDDLLALIAKQM